MQISQIVCTYCNGRGIVENWVVVETNLETNIGTAERKETTCKYCKGRGYTFYPVFTTPEAITIAKHYGFDINGLDEYEASGAATEECDD